MMYPRPPVDPELPTPPDYGRGGDELGGLVVLALAGAAIWKLGFWWGIGVFVAGFFVFAVVQGLNEALANDASNRNVRRRAPLPARVHALAGTFVAGFLGFGISAAIGAGTSADFLGVVAASATYLGLDTTVGWAIDAISRSGAVGSFCLVITVWMVLCVPLSAWLAPGYTVHGLAANVATAVLVMAANLLVWRASPWRNRWQPQPAERE